jgi:hypothetical protein
MVKTLKRIQLLEISGVDRPAHARADPSGRSGLGRRTPWRLPVRQYAERTARSQSAFRWGVALHSFEELNFMTQETYRIWHAVLDEREDDLRNCASGECGTHI